MVEGTKKLSEIFTEADPEEVELFGEDCTAIAESSGALDSFREYKERILAQEKAS